jgi:hypothetical protein
MPGVSTFVDQLEALGYDTEVLPGDVVVFTYEVEVGPLADRSVKLGIKPPPDFPVTPPGGPLISPRILPLNTDGSAGHPLGAVHPAETGGLADPEGEWEYWSRPIQNWPESTRDAKAYLCHIRTLFSTLPHDL